MEPLSPPDLTNTITGFCTILAGVIPLLLCRWLGPQPGRWLFVYWCIFITGLPTVGFHGWGTSWLRVSDTGSNLLLAWAIQLAVLGDYYTPKTRLRVAVVSGIVNLVAITQMIREEVIGAKVYLVDLGDFGGFHPGESVLILDSILVVGLMVAQRRQIAPEAMPLLRVVIFCFLVGVGLASATNTTLHARIWSYHALWHIVSATGFVFLWAFNHKRLHPTG